MSPMNWKECVAVNERWSIRSRLEWPPQSDGGFNCSQQFTISEVTGAISWVWTWPGDWLLRREPIRSFFEVESQATGHLFSTLLGWLLILLLVVGSTDR